uniref:SWIM-type domain-containing protein n=1 Tax=Romanomermis culicivorax TaxID=13658 RepID=A0A915JRD3_ROMCU
MLPIHLMKGKTKVVIITTGEYDFQHLTPNTIHLYCWCHLVENVTRKITELYPKDNDLRVVVCFNVTENDKVYLVRFNPMNCSCRDKACTHLIPAHLSYNLPIQIMSNGNITTLRQADKEETNVTRATIILDSQITSCDEIDDELPKSHEIPKMAPKTHSFLPKRIYYETSLF